MGVESTLGLEPSSDTVKYSSSDYESCSGATSPAHALASLAYYDGHVIVDFDETLYLRNSTEDFIDTAVPRTVAKIVLHILDLVKPWRILGGLAARDQYRIILISLLFPWTWVLWRSRAHRLGREFINQQLAETLKSHGDFTIASVGFVAIISPLLNAMRLGDRKLLGCRVLSGTDRQRGKCTLVETHLGRDALASALVITDSEDDRPLLNKARTPLLVRWPDAAYREAFADVYLPFEYLSKIKRPGARYVWRGVIQDDFAFWLLATLPLSAHPIWHCAALAFLIVSFWAIYEIGYVDNDRIGERYERDPRLTDAFFRLSVPTPPVAPWVWAGVTGLIGLALLQGGAPSASALISWTAVLIGAHLAFRSFNRLAKPIRPLLYPVLQAFRVTGIAAVASIAPIAVAGLCAAIVSPWIGYIVYRQRGNNVWPDLPLATIRLAASLVFSAVLLAALGLTTYNLLLAALFVTWNAFRARGELTAIVSRPIVVASEIATPRSTKAAPPDH